MGAWVFPVAASALLALGACSTAPQSWQESGGAAHPLVGKIYRIAHARQVSESDLIEAASAADFVLIGERHDNRDHHRLQARIVRSLQRHELDRLDTRKSRRLLSASHPGLAHSSRGPGRRPLTAVTRVRIPYALPASKVIT